MEDSSDNISWGGLASLVAARLGLTTNRSPTLNSVVERGVRYLVVDKSRQEIVFDIRALFLGFLAAGQQDRDSIAFGNTASWFTAWLSGFVGNASISETLRGRMVDPQPLFQAVSAGFRIVLSASVANLLEAAQVLASRTIGHPQYEARHLFCALVEHHHVEHQAAELFARKFLPQEIDDLKRTLIARIMEVPDSGETLEKWHEALLPGQTPSNPATPRRLPVHAVPGFSTDSVAGGSDILDTGPDARALARLICLDDSAPLAIAVLGGWGSGKSTFMQRLDAEVRNVVGLANRLTPSARDGAGPELVRKVVQIRFNAWQFVDANLWASLTAEFFDQLRAGGWDRLGEARHSGLVERVNRHVHSLSSDLEKKRQAIIESDKDVRSAQRKRDDAATKARTAGSRSFGQSALNTLGDIYKSQKSRLSKLGLEIAGEDTGDAIDAIVRTAADSHTIAGNMRSVFHVITVSRKRVWTVLSVLFAILAIGAGVWMWTWTHPWGSLFAAITAIGAVAASCRSLLPALAMVRDVSARAADIAGAVKTAGEAAVKELMAAELQLKEKTEEALALKNAVDEAARAVSRYVDPAATANPPRLLRFVLEDDPDTKALQAELGLVSRTRRLFQAVDEIVRAERGKHPDERVEGDVPDRIVLYIDDLDRCTEEQVYAALQAIHLLLAFELFVVVVGVDVEWVQRALAHSSVYRNAGPDPRAAGSPTAHTLDMLDRQRASRYLEKIFQIAFWLQPLATDAATGGSYGNYIRILATPGKGAPGNQRGVGSTTPGLSGVPAAAAGQDAGTSSGNSPQEAGTGVAATNGAGATGAVTDPGTQNSAVAGLETVLLEPKEIDFLASPAIARIAATTPRAVKRLLNIYRLARTRLGESGASIMADGKEPPLYPLIALMAAVESGQPVDVADAFYFGIQALESDDNLRWYTAASFDSGDGRHRATTFVHALARCAGIKDALEAVFEETGTSSVVKNLIPVAQFVRRYSFNSYR